MIAHPAPAAHAHAPQQHQAHAHVHAQAHVHAHVHVGAAAAGHVPVRPSSHLSLSTWLSSLCLQSPLDVYDIHELGWRRAVLLAKREPQEYLIRYMGWDTKWDEWIRASSNRLAPSNSKTASLAYTGFKGPRSSDEVASIELSRDWNVGRASGILCDVVFALQPHKHYCTPGQRVGSCTPMAPQQRTPSRNNMSREEKDDKPLVSGCTTPSASPMVRGLSGLGIGSPHLSPMTPNTASPSPSPTAASHTSPILYFPAHRHMIASRCPDLLKSALISLPPVYDFTRVQTRAFSHQLSLDTTASFSSSLDEFSLESIPPHDTRDDIQSLDDDENPSDDANTSLGSRSLSAFTELHADVQTLDISCVPNAPTMQNLLTYIYTGGVVQSLLPSVRHVFELASVAHLLHLDRLYDLCALSLNRMVTVDNVMQCMTLALKFQQNVLGEHSGVEDAISTIHLNSKNISHLLKVCLEFIVSHWEACWANGSNIHAFQSLSPSLFGLVLQLLPLKNVHAAPFSPTYPIVHPAACTLIQHFKQLYESRSEETCDFAIYVENQVIWCHKSVLACRSEYFRAMFRSPFEEGKESFMTFDSSQHSYLSTKALIKYLYSGDLKVGADCAVYLSNCTDFFGLSTDSLEHACQELVSQHQCLRVLRSAWKNCNEGLFKRACKFMDWSTLAALMNGHNHVAAPPTLDSEEEVEGDDDHEDEHEHEVDEDQEQEDVELEQQEDIEEEEDEEEHTEAPHTVSSTQQASLPESSTSLFSSSPRLSSSSSSSSFPPPSPSPTAFDPSDIEMWKAIVAEKANPSTLPTPFTRPSGSINMKRSRSSS